MHESVGDAIKTLNKKLKVSNIILKGDHHKLERCLRNLLVLNLLQS